MTPKAINNDQPKQLLGRQKGNLKMGLVGLANVGKSSTFNFLSKLSVPSENYPFCTIEPNTSRTAVEDPRFDKLCEIYNPVSKVKASLTIVDIAGLVRGAHKGEGLGNAFLSHIQAVDGIFQVVRAFDDDSIVHVEGSVDPVRDLQIIYDELLFKDLDRIEKLLADLVKQTQHSKDRQKLDDKAAAAHVLEVLKSGKWVASVDCWSLKEIEFLNNLQLLTAKPMVYLVNMSSSNYKKKQNRYLSKIVEWVQSNYPGPIIPYSAEFETMLLDNSEQLPEDGSIKSAVDKIVHAGYNALQLIHFFTAGEDEVKCWTIRTNTKAPQAAGTIHGDMEKGFICAEVTSYDDLIEHGSENAVKANGKVATRGKDYIVQDGDIMYFKFNPNAGKKK